MPDIEIVKLKLRRGTDTQRQSVTLEQGEMGYTTDKKRVWVGDGFTAGGHVAGNLVHAPITAGSRTNLTDAVQNDLVYDNNLLYQLSGTDYSTLSSWAFVGSQTDDTSIGYDVTNKLHVLSNSISASSLHQDVIATNGGLALNPTQGLSANVDGVSITVSNTGQLSVIGGNISSSNVGEGLSGGSGDQVGLFTTDSFTFVADQLEFANAPASTIDADAFKAASIGTTLDVAANTLNMTTIGGGQVDPFSETTYDQYGRVTSTTSTVTQNVTGADGSIYGGSIIDTVYTCQTLVTASSSNSDQSSTITAILTSAGFITFDSGACGNLAIPVFKY